MKIERNLFIPLRAQIERIIETAPELSSKEVFVDKDKKQQKQNLNQEKEQENSEEKTVFESQFEIKDVASPVLAKRLDIVA